MKLFYSRKFPLSRHSPAAGTVWSGSLWAEIYCGPSRSAPVSGAGQVEEEATSVMKAAESEAFKAGRCAVCGLEIRSRPDAASGMGGDGCISVWASPRCHGGSSSRRSAGSSVMQ